MELELSICTHWNSVWKEEQQGTRLEIYTGRSQTVKSLGNILENVHLIPKAVEEASAGMCYNQISFPKKKIPLMTEWRMNWRVCCIHTGLKMQGPGPGCGSGEIEKENCSRIHELRNRTTVHFWMQQMKEKNNIDIVKIVYKEQSSKLKALK